MIEVEETSTDIVLAEPVDTGSIAIIGPTTAVIEIVLPHGGHVGPIGPRHHSPPFPSAGHLAFGVSGLPKTRARMDKKDRWMAALTVVAFAAAISMVILAALLLR